MVTIPRQLAWTRDEYYRLGDLGLFAGRRVELIEGQIYEMGPMHSPHAVAVGLVDDALRAASGPAYHTRTQVPLALGERSDPEPDVALLPGSRRAYLGGHPTVAALIVEVADTSLDYDRDTKGPMYAKAGIADYWIVNLSERQVEIYRRPVSTSGAPTVWRYRERRDARPGEAITPLAVPGASIAVDDLLP